MSEDLIHHQLAILNRKRKINKVKGKNSKNQKINLIEQKKEKDLKNQKEKQRLAKKNVMFLTKYKDQSIPEKEELISNILQKYKSDKNKQVDKRSLKKMYSKDLGNESEEEEKLLEEALSGIKATENSDEEESIEEKDDFQREEDEEDEDDDSSSEKDELKKIMKENRKDDYGLFLK